MNYLLHHGLEASARRTPDHPALVVGDESLTYAELDAAANRLANLFIAHGMQPGDRIGIFLDKSLAAITGIYAALKAGGVYVPLDPAAPASRIAYIAGNCDVKFLVSSPKEQEAWGEIDGADPSLAAVVMPAGELEDPLSGPVLLTAADIAAMPDTSPGIDRIDQDLALMLYTSGSTGTPKGVMLTHRNVLTFTQWAVVEYGLTGEDRLTQMAPLHFDLSTFDLYSSAQVGATVYVVPRTSIMFPMQIRKLVERHEITVMYSVPSILTMMVERAKLETGDMPSLRTILFAGEVFPTKYLSRIMRLLPHVSFANLYGPTETNVCTAYTVPEPPPEDGPTISIGSAIANVETFVVKDDHTVAEPGEVGELHVRGGSVMAGYWGDEEKTAASLIANSFGLDAVYKTGDLVREEDDGNYTFLGRRDAQIKSRGYRIELGEIEAALNAHPGVVESVVSAIPDEKITNRLEAVAVASDIDQATLLKFIADRVPKYMLPEKIHFRELLPKTSTGKIDRQSIQRELEDQ